jgi:hypothetical protein
MITADDVASHLGVPVDDRVRSATDAAVAWAQRRRCNTDPGDLWQEADTRLGAILYATLLYQARATPSGIAGYDEASLLGGAGDGLYRAKELVGADPVVA